MPVRITADFRISRFFFAILLGWILGLSVYSYWLIDILPPTSRRIFLFTALAGLIGALGYFLLFELWIEPRWAALHKAGKWTAVIWGGLIGVCLMLGGTKAWTTSSRYVTFLLPSHDMQIRALAPQVSINWISTSLGDVSYDTLQLVGWERRGDQIVLTDVTNNSIHWAGKTGDGILILFDKAPTQGQVMVSWDDKQEIINLRNAAAGDFQYRHQFEVPFFASIAAVRLLVLVNFIAAGLALYLWFLAGRPALDEFLQGQAGLTYTVREKSRELKVEIVLVSILVFLAFLLRAFHLENLYPYADEYSHLLAVKELLSGQAIASVYQRGLFTVTLPAVASYRLFGEGLWAARLPGVVFNVLGIIPLFLIMRRINRPVAVLSCFLYATSPYLIAFSRNLREYASLPFYFFWVMYFIILFMDGFPHQFVFFRDWKKLQWEHAGPAILPAVFLGYVLVVDPFSTYKLILIAYGISTLFLVLTKFDLRDGRNWLLFVALSVIAYAGLGKYINKFLGWPIIDLRSLTFFFMNPPQQWYFDRVVSLPVLAILAGLHAAVQLRKRDSVPLLLSALFIGYMTFFILFFKGTQFTVHPRFVLVAQLWFIPILALGIQSLWPFVRGLTGGRTKMLPVLLAGALLFMSFNVPQTMFPTFFQGERMPVTDLVHDDVGMVNEYLMVHANAGDVLIGSLYASYVNWQGSPNFEQIYNYSNTVLDKRNSDGLAYISSILKTHPAGWIVIDEQRLDFIPPSLPGKQAVIEGRLVKYVGKFLTQHVWRWGVQ